LNIVKYKNFIQNKTTLYDFLDFILNNLESEFNDHHIVGGFIAYLDETKVTTRFKIISAIGKFLNSHKIKVITSKEIDKLSIVYMTKKNIVKENLYIDIINKKSQDIFIYLEFKENLNQIEQNDITNFFDKLNALIKNTQWGTNINTIVEQIEELPALEKTIVDVLEFSIKKEKLPEELIEILSSDPLIVATLLKTINSAIFGFRNEVESLDNLIYLMGIDFTISIVLANSIQDAVKINLDSYGIDETIFKEQLSLKIKFMTSWLRQEDIDIQKKLYLPLILHDIGKFIISNEINNLNKSKEFLKDISNKPQSIDKIERKYCEHTANEVTVLVLEYWKINQNIINTINGHNESISGILSIINTLFNMIKPLDDLFISNAIKKAEVLNLDTDLLKAQIEDIKDCL